MFQKIVGVDQTGLTQNTREELEKLTTELVLFDQDPTSEEEVIQRAKGAQVLLVSWRTPITEKVIASLPELRYIGMCCSLIDENSANVDVAFARSQGIEVRGVRDYGDEGLVEFIFSELIRLMHGFGEHQWADAQHELSDKTLGIIGFGVTGQMLAHRGAAFGMKILYYSRTRKPELETEQVQYAPLDKLLAESDVISTHVPKNSIVITSEDFSKTKEKAVLVNTSLEPTFDLDGFEPWIGQKGHYAIFDRGGLGREMGRLTAYPRVLFTPKVTGFTHQATYRLSEKVLKNLLDWQSLKD